MKRFTLKAFLIAIAAIALLLAYGMLQYRYWNLEAEVVRLRVEGGHLVPVDKSLVNIIEVPSPEPHVWRWKVYAPPGTQFEYGIRFSDIPPTGVPNPQSSGEFYIESTTNGVLVTATIASDIDDGYVLILDCKDRFSRFSRISRTNLPLSEWVDGSAEIRTAGEDGVETFDYDQPIVLHRRRLMEPVSPTTSQVPKGDARGFIIWITPQKKP